ncbi:MAG: heme ABC exporter ATP-binding protein CcmA [Thermoflexales bacterium]|nr:heme ABC exporter ATP-binding protein CcmA [Thermoflexales bacterium]
MLLEALGIRKAFALRPVLRGVDLTVAPGEVVALLGPNGCGKSTLLRIVATLLRPDAGQVRIDGIDALREGGAARARIGVLTHQTLLYPELTGRENLRFHADLRGLPDAGARVDAALAMVDLTRRGEDRVRGYSRGMAQRLSLARALLHRPRLLLLDEPYTGLDQASAARLSDTLGAFAADGGGIVLSTHELGRGMEAVTRRVQLGPGGGAA